MPVLLFLLKNWRIVLLVAGSAVYGYLAFSWGQSVTQARWDVEKARIASEVQKNGDKANDVETTVRALPVGDALKRLRSDWSR